jgi:hypothetical protein
MARDSENLKRLAERCVKAGVHSTDDDAASVLLEAADALLKLAVPELAGSDKPINGQAAAH